MDYERIVKVLPNNLKENEYFRFLLEELSSPIKKIHGTKLEDTYHFYVPVSETAFFPFTLSISSDKKVSLANSWIDIRQTESGIDTPIERFSSVYTEEDKNGNFTISNRDVSIETMQIDRIKRNSNESIEIVSEPKEVKFQTLEIRDYNENGFLKSISIKKYTPRFINDKKSKIWDEMAPVQELSYRYFINQNESVIYTINYDTLEETYYHTTGAITDDEVKEKIEKSQYLEYLNEKQEPAIGPKKVLVLPK